MINYHIYVLFIWWDTQCHTPSTWGEIAIRGKGPKMTGSLVPVQQMALVTTFLDGAESAATGEFPTETHQDPQRKGRQKRVITRLKWFLLSLVNT